MVLLPRLVLVCMISLIIIPLNKCFAQWDVKELHTLSGKISASDMIVVGNLDKSPGNEIVWLVTDQTGGNHIMILNGSTGEVKWRSKTYHKIFPSSLKIADINGNNSNKLIFTGQLTSFDPISMYVVSYTHEAFTDSIAKPDPVNTIMKGSQSENSAQNSPPISNKSSSSTDTPQQDAQNPPRLTGDNSNAATIPYTVSERSYVRIDIFNGTGEFVKTLVKDSSNAGVFAKSWDGMDEKGQKLQAGTYFYTITIGRTTQVRKPFFMNP